MDMSQLVAAQWQALLAANYGLSAGGGASNMLATAMSAQLQGTAAQLQGTAGTDSAQTAQMLMGMQTSANPATSSYGAAPRAKGASRAPYEPPATHGKDGQEIVTLWIGDLLPHTTQRDLLIAFGKLGSVLNVNVKGGDRLQGWVRFSSRAEAEEVLLQAEQRPVLVLGQPVTCRWARNNVFGGATAAAAAMQDAIEMTDELCTIWVGSIPPDTTDQDFISAFNPYGELVAAALNRKASNNGLMAGWVRYRTRMEAEAALTFVQSQAIVVNNAIVVGQWAKANAKLNMGNSWERALPPSSHTAGQAALPTMRNPQLALPWSAPGMRPVGVLMPPRSFAATGRSQLALTDQSEASSEQPAQAEGSAFGAGVQAEDSSQTSWWQPRIAKQQEDWQFGHSGQSTQPAEWHSEQWQSEPSGEYEQWKPDQSHAAPPSLSPEMRAMFAQFAAQHGS